MAWYKEAKSKPHTVFVGRFRYICEPSKVHGGSIIITKVLDRIECDNYYDACNMAHEICGLNGKGYACSIVPKGMLANSLSASYVWCDANE